MISTFVGSTVLCEMIKQEQNNVDISIVRYGKMKVLLVISWYLQISSQENFILVLRISDY